MTTKNIRDAFVPYEIAMVRITEFLFTVFDLSP